jgi:hypothetical protein
VDSTRVNRHVYELLTLAISWLPYGGAPDDEIYPKFGLTQNQYLNRLRHAVEKNRRWIQPEIAARLLSMSHGWPPKLVPPALVPTPPVSRCDAARHPELRLAPDGAPPGRAAYQRLTATLNPFETKPSVRGRDDDAALD